MVRRGPCRRPVKIVERGISVRRAAPSPIPGGRSPVQASAGRAHTLSGCVSRAVRQSLHDHDQDAASLAPRLGATAERGVRPESALARAGLALSGAVAPPPDRRHAVGRSRDRRPFPRAASPKTDRPRWTTRRRRAAETCVAARAYLEEGIPERSARAGVELARSVLTNRGGGGPRRPRGRGLRRATRRREFRLNGQRSHVVARSTV
jgi:hypothetical protein